jgi:hypothetical protein
MRPGPWQEVGIGLEKHFRPIPNPSGNIHDTLACRQELGNVGMPERVKLPVRDLGFGEHRLVDLADEAALAYEVTLPSTKQNWRSQISFREQVLDMLAKSIDGKPGEGHDPLAAPCLWFLETEPAFNDGKRPPNVDGASIKINMLAP